MKNLNNNELDRLWLENQILKDENEELKKKNKINEILLCVSNLVFCAYIIIKQIL